MPTDKGPAKGAGAGTSLQRQAGARHVFHRRRRGAPAGRTRIRVSTDTADLPGYVVRKAWREVTHSQRSIEDGVVLMIPTLLEDLDEECPMSYSGLTRWLAQEPKPAKLGLRPQPSSAYDPDW